MFQPGQKIWQLTLMREIGNGAYGVVWLANHKNTTMEREVAVKFPYPSAVDWHSLRQETDTWSRASDHPNVLTFFHADNEKGQVFLVSQYATDGPLSKWLKRHDSKAPSIVEAVKMTKAILKGLVHIHSKGIIHRDLKPSNVLLHGGEPLIADFGLARHTQTDNKTLRILGTPAYMAPEVWDGDRCVESDIWAVGIMFYEMLSGEDPFQFKKVSLELWEIEEKIKTEPHKPLPSSVPCDIRLIVEKALQKKKQDRYQSAMNMLEALNMVDAKSPDRTPPDLSHSHFLARSVMGILTVATLIAVSWAIWSGFGKNDESSLSKNDKKFVQHSHDKVRGQRVVDSSAAVDEGTGVVSAVVATKLVRLGDPHLEFARRGASTALRKIGNVEFHPGQNLANGEVTEKAYVMTLGPAGTGFGSNKDDLVVLFISWDTEKNDFDAAARVMPVDSVMYPGFYEYHVNSDKPGYLVVALPQ